MTHEAERQARRRLYDLTRLVSDWIWETDREGRLVFVSERTVEVLGIHPLQMVGRQLAEVGMPDGEAEFPDLRRPFRDVPFRVSHRDGTPRHFLLSGLPVFADDDGSYLGARGTAEDITQRRAAEEALRASEERTRLILDTVVDGVISIDEHGVIEAFNPAAEHIFGWRAAEVIGRNVAVLMPDPYRSEHDAYLRRYLRTGRPRLLGRGAELPGLRKDGTTFPMEVAIGEQHRDGTRRFTALVRDITERKETDLRIHRLAYRDTLTDLPNRVRFRQILEMVGSQCRAEGQCATLLLLDLDDFKGINDTLGHDIGDELVRVVADRLRAVVGPGWVDPLGAGLEPPPSSDRPVLARFGGDEFALLFVGGDSRARAQAAAERILAALAHPFAVGGNEVFTGVGIGLSTFPDDGGDIEILLRNADLALYRAKAEGRNVCRPFIAGYEAAVRARKAMENDLRNALARDELGVVFQPQLNLRRRAICGTEALLRWNRPGHGPVSPAEFIPVAEATGLIVPIGEWVLRQACARNKVWQKTGLKPVPVAVNLSAVQFRDPELVPTIERVLAETGLDPAYLHLEITESLFVQATEGTRGALEQLRRLGIRISLDDFGTGYSSLGYLTRFRIDKIKLDRSFVGNIASDVGTAAIVRSVAALGHVLGMTVTVEGVEDSDQLAILADMGVDEVQGHFFSPAVNAERIADLLAAQAQAVSV